MAGKQEDGENSTRETAAVSRVKKDSFVAIVMEIQLCRLVITIEEDASESLAMGKRHALQLTLLEFSMSKRTPSSDTKEAAPECKTVDRKR
ncbi:hypothetical protein DMENIID0001_141830 [Sergentomyia squamirostris]